MDDDLNILLYLKEHFKFYDEQYTFSKLKTLTHAIENKNIKIVKHLLQTNSIHYHKICNEDNFSHVFEYLNLKLIFSW